MTETSKYNTGKVYRISCRTTDTHYIGSTIKPLGVRLAQHEHGFIQFDTCKSNNYCSSYEVLRNGNYSIELLELVPCNNKVQLYLREKHHIDSNVCVNKNAPIITEQCKQVVKVARKEEFVKQAREKKLMAQRDRLLRKDELQRQANEMKLMRAEEKLVKQAAKQAAIEAQQHLPANEVTPFLQTHCIRTDSSSDKVSRSVLYDMYCKMGGSIVSCKLFVKFCRENGIVEKRVKGVYYYAGIKLREV